LRVAIVPIREIENTKLRLATALTQSQRSELSTALLHRTLRSVEGSSIDYAWLVSSLPETLSGLQQYQKLAVVRESIFHGGVNSAMRDGFVAAKSRFEISASILIPSDLPLVSATALNEVLESLEKYDMIINPSEKRDGTNLLGFKGPDFLITLHYDDDSYRKHLLEAGERHLNYLAIEKQEFLHDLDSYEDLSFAKKHFAAVTFEELVKEIRGF
jgi:2-phospho-L-lactate guanylyltransferase